MVRALFSVVVVLLLSAIAFLLYANYVHDERNSTSASETLKGTPPPVPRPIVPLPIVQPPPQPQPAPEVQPRERTEAHPPAAPAPVPAPEPEGRRTYTVVAGDSLWSISRKNFGTPEHSRKIAEMNKLGPKDRIKPGQVLYIPDLPMVEGSDAGNGNNDPDQWADKGKTDTDEVMPPTLSTNLPKK
jgi:nucleoid-associated protein YgaU